MNNPPNVVHFVYPVTDLTRPLSFLNYIAVRRALTIHRPDRIYFWTNIDELEGQWGDLITPMIELRKCDLVTEYDGTPIKWPQYMSDVMRLQILYEHGGIYMDTDMLLVKPLYEWMGSKLIMSWEPSEPLGQSACNALIISPPKNPFLNLWLEYLPEALKSETWAEGGVNLPASLWKSHRFTAREFTEIIDPYFFCPLDLKANWLFDPALKAEAKYKTKESLAIHAFETFWRVQVSDVTPEWCKSNDCLFSDLI
jgi:Glycosyltransferase sugar-binding region containing DXD motif